MTQPEIQLKRVHEKILLLLKQHQVLQKENERLKEDIRKMTAYGMKLFTTKRKNSVSRQKY